MLKFLSDFVKILLITFVLFIILNSIIIITWPIYINNKMKDYYPYSKEIIKNLQMSEEDALQLYTETWIDRSFIYSQFIEHIESPTNGKFVNISKEFGRKIENPPNCKKRFFFYGGSTTWGYNVADNQTIPAYFLKALINNNYQDYCVYNFGGGSYFSTQENIRFQKHLLTDKINQNDFVFFIDGHNESGFRKTRITDFLTEAFEPSNQKFWKMYELTFVTFIKSLPIIQLSNRLLKRLNLDLDKNVSQAGSIKLTPDDLLSVYQTNINIRSGICNIEKINCYSFLQPFASVHGVDFTTRDGVKLNHGDALGGAPEIGNKADINNDLTQKYNILKNAKGKIDISSALDSQKILSLVDAAHYSPEANKLIAERIFLEIKENLN